METKLFTFNVELYHQPVTIIVGEKDVAIEWLRKRMNPVAFEDTSERLRGSSGYALQADTGGGVHNMIWVPNIDEDYDTLVHETLHIAFYILDYVGVPANPDSQEAIAYLQGYLLSQAKKLYAKSPAYKAPKSHSKRATNNNVSDFESASMVRSGSYRKAMVRR